MRKKTLLICLCTFFLLSGCSSVDSKNQSETPAGQPPTTFAPKQSAVQAALFDKMRDTPVSYEAEVAGYEMGSLNFLAQSGKIMPYQLRGVIGVPKGEGPFPLILITHGSHSNDDGSLRFDTGFTYLVQALAENGYVAVSMDMSRPYLWEYGDGDDKEKSLAVAYSQISMLRSQSEVFTGDFPVNLIGKIDWDKLGLIGHSRGGDTIFDIALVQQGLGLHFSSLLSVAPAMPADLESKLWPEADTAILVPEYDGDVVSLDGFAFQTKLEEHSGNLHVATLLKKANHNYFNTNLTANDALLARTPEELTDQLSPKAQQDFLVAYALDFFDGSLYDGDQMQPNRMYGLDVAFRAAKAGDYRLYQAGQEGLLSGDGLDFSAVTDSWFYEDDETEADTVTFGQESHKTKRLLKVQWDKLGAALTLSPEHSDFSGSQAIVLRAVPDPADERNAGLCQSLTVSLEDASGNQASVTLPAAMNSLRPAEGKLDITPLENGEIRFWSHPSPLTDTRIPLASFEGIDLKNITAVTLRTDVTAKGSLLLECIFLQ